MSFLVLGILYPVFAISLFYLAFKLIVYPALFSPLSRIPAAHPLAPWTSLWILYVRLTAGENRIIYEAHLKSGALVRLGPHEVSLNSLEGLRKIYIGNYDKHQWFANAGMVNGVSNSFSSLDNRSHAESRRLVTGVYSKSFLQNSKDAKVVFDEIILRRLIPSVTKAAQNREIVDAIGLSEAIAYDVITAMIFGLDAVTDTIRDTASRQELCKEHDIVRPYFQIFGELLWPIEILGLIGVKTVPAAVFQSFGNIVSRVSNMCKKAESGKGSKAIVYDHCLRTFDKSSFSSSKDEKIVAEMFDQTVAGLETLAITFTYLFYELSQNPQLQVRLRQEVSTIVDRELPEARELDSLPLLHAIVYETLRTYPPATMPLPRIVPKNGAQFHEQHIPEGIRISCNAYTLNRNENVFNEPEKWNPERWLTSDENQLKEMKRWFWTFGSGARMCLGIHLAIQELKYVIAAVYKNFESEIVEAGDMTQLDGFLSGPRGRKLDIRFREVTR